MKLPIPRFLWSWPSWLVELLSGGCCVAIAYALTTNLVYTLIVATLLSLVYEAYLDANGLEWKDIRQRQIGIVLAVVVLWVL